MGCRRGVDTFPDVYTPLLPDGKIFSGFSVLKFDLTFLCDVPSTVLLLTKLKNCPLRFPQSGASVLVFSGPEPSCRTLASAPGDPEKVESGPDTDPEDPRRTLDLKRTRYYLKSLGRPPDGPYREGHHSHRGQCLPCTTEVRVRQDI